MEKNIQGSGASVHFEVPIRYLEITQIAAFHKVSSNTRCRTLPEFQSPRALVRLAFSSLFQEHSDFETGKVLDLITKQLIYKDPS